MRLVVTRDLEEFASRATDFLAERVERNILATVLVHALRGRYDAPGAFAYGLDDDDAVCAAALRTPLAPMLACELDDVAAGILVERWLCEDPQRSGVCGVTATARAVADAWARRSGGRGTVTCASGCTCSPRSAIRRGRPQGGHASP